MTTAQSDHDRYIAAFEVLIERETDPETRHLFERKLAKLRYQKDRDNRIEALAEIGYLAVGERRCEANSQYQHPAWHTVPALNAMYDCRAIAEAILGHIEPEKLTFDKPAPTKSVDPPRIWERPEEVPDGVVVTDAKGRRCARDNMLYRLDGTYCGGMDGPFTEVHETPA